MMLTDIQAWVAARIAADAVLGPLGPAVQYDPLADEKATVAALRERMAATGVAIVIDPPYADGAATSGHGAALLNAVVVLKVAESPVVAHEPRGTALVSAVIRALIARDAAGREQMAVAGFDRDEDEHGYVLHVIDFRVPSVIP